MNEEPQAWLVLGAFAPPFVAAMVLAVRAWSGKRPSESFVKLTGSWAFGVSFLAILTLTANMMLLGRRMATFRIGDWFGIGHYHFPISLVADHLSIPFGLLSSGLLLITGLFSGRYLHRESGYLRFYLLLCLFGSSTLLLVFAGGLDFAFFGWELVGLTSTLLIAFFHQRAGPVRHAFRAYITYRICDFGFLAAAVWLHHAGQLAAAPQGDFPWWTINVPVHARDAAIVGFLLLWATLGKAGQVPFGGWLPRAMEGPTPSSAIFYGAISVHLGPYLLLRSAGILEAVPVVAHAVIGVGLVTAVHGTLVGRVQTDIKSRLAYATMAQVGLIFAEIGWGFRYLALVHIAGHAALRCLQILRSPSIVHDYFRFERKLGGTLPRLGRHYEKFLPQPLQLWLYRGALERGFLDALLTDRILHPIIKLSRRIDTLQEHFADFLIKLGKNRASSDDTRLEPAEVEQ